MNPISTMRGLLGLSFGLIVCLQLGKGAENQQNDTQIGWSPCEPGLEWDREYKKCRPICIPSCGPNGRCVQRDTCQCYRGYAEENGVCQPVCTNGCGPNGICVAPETCGCEANYKWIHKLRKCQAMCNPKCQINAFCSAPDICACNEGYSEENGMCQPICRQGCGAHGRCVAPDKCDCSTGYEWNNKSSKCIPKCSPKCGLHSFCHRTNECKCINGYKPDDMKSLSCSWPLRWWIYLIIAIIATVIICSVAGIIYYFVARSRNVNYYPNFNFSDTTQIVQ